MLACGLLFLGGSGSVATLCAVDASALQWGCSPEVCKAEEERAQRTTIEYEERLNREASEREAAERQAREATERETRAASEREAVALAHEQRCLVPNVKGDSLSAARKALRRARCRVGTVTRESPGRGPLVVVAQGVSPGHRLPKGSAVRLKLGSGSSKADRGG